MNGYYQIYRRNRTTGIRDTLIQRYTEFTLHLNWGEVSKFTISGKTVGEIELQAGDGVCFYRNNELILSGIVEEIRIKCEDVGSGLKEWTADGNEDSIIFSHFLTWADPATPTFADGVVDKVSDYAYNRQLHYIRYNMGADAYWGRPIEGLTLPESANLGQNTDSVARYEMLDKILQDIGAEVVDGRENGLYPRFVWNPDTGAKSIIIPQQRDMTASVIVAPEYGNIIDWEKRYTVPTCNAVVVVSSDFKDEDDNDRRIFVYQNDADSEAKFGHIEKLVTASDVKVGTYEGKTVTEEEAYDLLNNRAKAELEAGAYKLWFSGTMVETPELQFMTHWRCGDLVTCIIDGESFETTIKTVEINFSDNFEAVKPTLGECEKGVFARVFQNIKGLDTRMKQKELD